MHYLNILQRLIFYPCASKKFAPAHWKNQFYNPILKRVLHVSLVCLIDRMTQCIYWEGRFMYLVEIHYLDWLSYAYRHVLLSGSKQFKKLNTQWSLTRTSQKLVQKVDNCLIYLLHCLNILLRLLVVHVHATFLFRAVSCI